MFLSAKAFFENHIPGFNMLLIRTETQLPEEFVKRYKKNVVDLTPKKTGALRRSIITQVIGNEASISWRMPYAAAQNEGGHNGVTYRNYTTPGTGPRFANIAFRRTQAEMPAVLRELGVTK